jgi:uncharacterized protein involved in exopolysaccharide biosynthesis
MDLNLQTLWRIVLEWRWLILGSVAVALAGAIVVTLLTTPLYKSTATLEISPPSIEILENGKGQPVVPNDREFLATQFGLLNSRTLAERVAQELNLPGNEQLFRATRIAPPSSRLPPAFCWQIMRSTPCLTAGWSRSRSARPIRNSRHG